ncbi:MAG: hypothetical protein GF375_00490 [Candidatus Omnitrophica bacterium]|nr:hypothetical protein [Candidatus Omnitrophota bacterium]
MGISKKDVENINQMNNRLAKKKKPGFWGGVRKVMQARATENRQRREAEDKIRKKAFVKARRSEIKRQAARRGRQSVTSMRYTARGNYNPIGALFDSGMEPAPRPKRKSSKKGKKKGSKKRSSPGLMSIDPVDNWGLW